nr:EOG090X0EYV [Polyphemus pediculus]
MNVIFGFKHILVRSPRNFSTHNNVAFSSVSIKSDQNKTRSRGPKGFTEDGGHIYHGFTYYPRNPDQMDPPCEPSKVFMVQRTRSLKGKPYWDKSVMTQLGLNGSRSEIAIIPNTPAMNAMLWKVKHLIQITPITFPQGISSDGDITGAKLKENGELVFVPKLKNDALSLQLESSSEKPQLNGEDLAKYLRAKWLKPWV